MKNNQLASGLFWNVLIPFSGLRKSAGKGRKQEKDALRGSLESRFVMSELPLPGGVTGYSALSVSLYQSPHLNSLSKTIRQNPGLPKQLCN